MRYNICYFLALARLTLATPRGPPVIRGPQVDTPSTGVLQTMRITDGLLLMILRQIKEFLLSRSAKDCSIIVTMRRELCESEYVQLQT